MATIPTNFNWGNALYNFNPELARQLSEAYTTKALVLNTKASKYVADGADPPASSTFNKNFDVGDLYIRTDTDTAWIMTSRTTSIAATWTQIT